MKRYRVIGGDLDSRASTLSLEMRETWEPKIQAMHRQNLDNTRRGLIEEFGEENAEAKILNFKDLGNARFSIIAFHNDFLRQARNAFVIGSYYPALTAACALGERLLNHLLLTLRDSYRHTPEYKTVYRKSSFDDWNVAIKTLESWKILLPEAVSDYWKLARLRNRVIHFNPETDHNDRELALDAIQTLSRIVNTQFTAFGLRPWFIKGILGASFIKKDSETDPFVRTIYLPNCVLVGPKHKLEAEHTATGINWIVRDEDAYDQTEISDEQFAELIGNPN